MPNSDARPLTVARPMFLTDVEAFLTLAREKWREFSSARPNLALTEPELQPFFIALADCGCEAGECRAALPARAIGELVRLVYGDLRPIMSLWMADHWEGSQHFGRLLLADIAVLLQRADDDLANFEELNVEWSTSAIEDFVKTVRDENGLPVPARTPSSSTAAVPGVDERDWNYNPIAGGDDDQNDVAATGRHTTVLPAAAGARSLTARFDEHWDDEAGAIPLAQRPPYKQGGYLADDDTSLQLIGGQGGATSLSSSVAGANASRLHGAGAAGLYGSAATSASSISAMTGTTSGGTLPMNAAWSRVGGGSMYGITGNVDSMVGLFNQGATCYLNSLIQSLFMTPEFRAAIYNWHFDEEKDGRMARCIPLQLQLLFCELQKRSSKAISTTGLTKSFGWDGAEAFTQHDVQELCRVLFDALEHVFKGTPQENIVNTLYQGKMRDYLKCKVCGNDSGHMDNFLDISLEVSDVSSVEEAFAKFIQPELLSGDNQYSCEHCKTKVDALKGLAFVEFPYLLTLQLKRFTFDYTYMRRVKLNSLVTFPMMLNLDPYIGDESKAIDESRVRVFKDTKKQAAAANPYSYTSSYYYQSSAKSLKEQLADAEADFKFFTNLGTNYVASAQTAAAKIERLKGEIAAAGGGPADADADADEAPSTPTTAGGRASAAANVVDAAGVVRGPADTSQVRYLYELFAILIHSGGSSGGHYYAYVKSLDTGKWYDFNDSTVTEVREHEIVSSYGDKKDSYGNSSYGTNAYMLMYRRVDPAQNARLIDEMPAHVAELLARVQEKEAADRLAGTGSARRSAAGEFGDDDDDDLTKASGTRYTLVVRYIEDTVEIETTVKVTGSEEMSEVALMAATALVSANAELATSRADLPLFAASASSALDATRLRLRNYSKSYDKLERPCRMSGQVRFSGIYEGTTNLVLEVSRPKPPASLGLPPPLSDDDDEQRTPAGAPASAFAFVDETYNLVRLQRYVSETNSFSPPHAVMLSDEATVSDLQRVLTATYGISEEFQLVVTTDFYGAPTEILPSSRLLFRSYPYVLSTYGRNKVFVEDMTPAPPPTPQASADSAPLFGSAVPIDGAHTPPPADPPPADPPVADPPVADPPVADPPVADPPVADPPVADPPTADVPRTQPVGAVSQTDFIETDAETSLDTFKIRTLPPVSNDLDSYRVPPPVDLSAVWSAADGAISGGASSYASASYQPLETRSRMARKLKEIEDAKWATPATGLSSTSKITSSWRTEESLKINYSGK